MALKVNKDKVDFVFEEWQSKLDDYSNKIKSEEIQAIRNLKDEILAQIKQEVYNQIMHGCFINDDEKIIISAPEIIIGNVDKSGQLKMGDSKIRICGTDISLESIGNGGIIQARANKIKQTALDPGPEGNDEIVYKDAEISALSRKITLDSNNAFDSLADLDQDTYSKFGGIYTRNNPKSLCTDDHGISIHSDSSINIASSIQYKTLKNDLEALSTQLNQEISSLKQKSQEINEKAKLYMELMTDVLSSDKDLKGNDDLTSLSATALDELHIRVGDVSLSYFATIDTYLDTLSRLAEGYRKQKVLEKKRSVLNSFTLDEKSNNTNTSLSLLAEKTMLYSYDGDGKVHKNSKIDIVSGKVDIRKHSWVQEYSLNLDFPIITINTNKRPDNNKVTAEGNIKISTKNIYAYTDDIECQEKTEKHTPAKGSSITLSSQNISFTGYDATGKAVGTVDINGKEINITTNDYNKEGEAYKLGNFTDKGNIAIRSKKLNFGTAEGDSSPKCESISITGNTITQKASKDMNLAVGESTMIDIQENKLNIKSEKIFQKGEEVEFTGKVKTENVEAKKIETDKVVANQTQTSTLSKK
jgi:hypothetical protein